MKAPKNRSETPATAQ